MFKNFKELKKKVVLFISLISIFVIALITKNISYGINVEEKNKKLISNGLKNDSTKFCYDEI